MSESENIYEHSHPRQVIDESQSIHDPVEWAPSRRRAYDPCKRIFDVLLSAASLVILGPIMAMIAIAIKLTSPGPAMFRQMRLGLNGKAFVLLKFRTMHMNASPELHHKYVQQLIHERQSGTARESPIFKTIMDPRVTTIGRLLRRTALDELPQLFNVLIGDMTFVGPRAPLSYEWNEEEDWMKARLSCKPGITGLWQIKGRSSVSFDEMMRLDLYYAQHRSFAMDLRILFRTPFAVVRDDGAY